MSCGAAMFFNVLSSTFTSEKVVPRSVRKTLELFDASSVWKPVTGSTSHSDRPRWLVNDGDGIVDQRRRTTSICFREITSHSPRLQLS